MQGFLWNIKGCYLQVYFRFRDIAWVPNKIFIPICTSPNHIWKYLSSPLQCWLFEGTALSIFSSLCLVMSLVSLHFCGGFSSSYTVHSIFTSPPHPCCPFLPTYDSHTDFSFSVSNTLILLTSRFCSCCDFCLESTFLLCPANFYSSFGVQIKC